MLAELIKKELQEDVQSYRVFLSSLIVFLSILAFSAIFVGHYQLRRGYHERYLAANNRNLQAFAASPSSALNDVSLFLVMRPEPESFLSDSHEDDLPRGFLYSPSGWPFRVNFISRAAGIEGTANDSELGFSPDLSFLVQVLMSFLAVALSFNAVTKEKEDGTLGLILSYSTKRAYFILAKFTSILCSLGLPLALGLLSGYIFLNLSGVFLLSAEALISMLIFFLVSIIYIAFFVLLGIFCSTLYQSSDKSLVMSLLLWILIVLIIPRSAGMLSGIKNLGLPTSQEIKQLADRAANETAQRFERLLPPNSGTDIQKSRRLELLMKMWHEEDKARQDVLDSYLQKKFASMESIKKIHIFSPASLYEHSASSIAGTGLFHLRTLWTSVRRYNDDFTLFMQKENSTLEPGSFFYLCSESISDEPLDFSSLPKLEDSGIPPGGRLRETLPSFSILIIYCLFLFTAVLFRFKTCDIR